ncbi:hypothetical protein CBFG_04894 [Clostridiales bacterium 1_7_47FAA]|nr:hypothetical protein CBFG_04894 [Clostridiales bacterium 1_7_47FAA]
MMKAHDGKNRGKVRKVHDRKNRGKARKAHDDEESWEGKEGGA